MSYVKLAKAARAALDGPSPGVVDADEEKKLERLAAEVLEGFQAGTVDKFEKSSAVNVLLTIAGYDLPGQHLDPWQRSVAPEALGSLKTFLLGDNPLGENLATPEVAPYLARVDGRGQRVPFAEKGLASAFDLNEQLTPYGTAVFETGVPELLTRPSTKLPVFDFAPNASGSGMFGGTGAHLGGGYVLTNMHVVAGQLDPSLLPESTIFTRGGPSVAGGTWTVKALPERGSYVMGRDHQIPANVDTSRFNDFALVQVRRGARPAGAFKEIRKTADLKRGERLWILGDRTGGRIRVTTGVFAGLRGGRGVVKDVELEEGFSGSPALDAQGRWVGLIYAMNDGGNGFLIPTERLAPFLDEAGRKLKDLPRPGRVGF